MLGNTEGQRDWAKAFPGEPNSGSDIQEGPGRHALMDLQQEWLSRVEMYNDHVDDVLVLSGWIPNLGKDGDFYTERDWDSGAVQGLSFQACTVHKLSMEYPSAYQVLDEPPIKDALEP